MVSVENSLFHKQFMRSGEAQIWTRHVPCGGVSHVLPNTLEAKCRRLDPHSPKEATKAFEILNLGTVDARVAVTCTRVAATRGSTTESIRRGKSRSRQGQSMWSENGVDSKSLRRFAWSLSFPSISVDTDFQGLESTTLLFSSLKQKGCQTFSARQAFPPFQLLIRPHWYSP